MRAGSAAATPIARPVSIPPVTEIFATSGWRTSASPTGPRPVTTFRTPGGRPTSVASRATSSIDVEVTSDGFTTTVLPAASAGATAIIDRNAGEFQGMITPTTPRGSRTV